MNTMGASQLSDQLKQLSEAIRAVEATLEERRAAHDELAVHIFVSRRIFQRAPSSKDGKQLRRAAEQTYWPACHLGFKGDFREWYRLMDAYASPKDALGPPGTQKSDLPPESD